MKIKLFQIIPSKPIVDEKFGLSEGRSDIMYCNGIDCISSCLSELFAKGYKTFSIGYLGEVSCLTDKDK